MTLLRLSLIGVGRGSGVFFGGKRQRFSPINSPKETPDPFIQRFSEHETVELQQARQQQS